MKTITATKVNAKNIDASKNFLLRTLFVTLLVIFSLGVISNQLIGTVKAAEPTVDAINTDEDFFEEEDPFLDVDDAFAISSDVIDDEIIVRWKIADTYYLYKHRFGFSAEGATLSEAIIPDGEKKVDEYFGEVEVYHHHVEVEIPFSNAGDEIILQAKFQGCAEAGLCYTPTTRTLIYKKQFDGSYKLTSGVETKIKGIDRISNTESPNNKSIKNEPTSSIANQKTDSQSIDDNSKSQFVGQTGNLKNALESDETLWTLLKFLAAGILLTFTPCVLPMIPILSSTIAGQGDNITTGKAFRLSFVYVQAMAITYAILGVLVAGAGSSLSGYLQSPWILSIVAVIFVALAFSMFGFFEIKLPSFIEQRVQSISQNQHGGNYIGVALMGVLSTLIVSPCTTAPLTAALLFIAQSGDRLIGGLSLYFLGLGMGLPLLLIGISEGKLIPKAGSWMDYVKSLFGFLMLGMAIYITDHLMPASLVLFLWGVLLIIASSQFGLFDKVESKSHGIMKSFASILFFIGLIYLIGSAMGNKNPLKPLETHFSNQTTNEKHGLNFQSFKDLDELNLILAKAKKVGQPVMVDFFADWCVACYEFVDYTFSQSNVQNFLKENGVLLLQVDVTNNTASDIKLMQHYNILGLPSILFINSKGIEQKKLRATGFENAETFVKRLKTAYQ